MPVLDPNNRRPKTVLSREQEQAIDKAFEETKLSPRLFYHELNKRRKIKVLKSKMYAYLKSRNLVVPNPKKQKKRTRCRYERDHSGSLVHGDSHRTGENHPYCIIWLDNDASRRILSGAGADRTGTGLALSTFKAAEAAGYSVFIREANTGRGAS